MAKQKERTIRLCRSQRRVSEAPVLTLEGLWLQDLGFKIGIKFTDMTRRKFTTKFKTKVAIEGFG
jgi:hypothetical protein